MSDAYQVTRDLERALCDYTGAKYAVAVNSCTAALQLALAWDCNGFNLVVDIPKKTYPSVPMAIKNAGCSVSFDDRRWRGAYNLIGSKVWDCARRFTSSMYVPGQYQCVSFSSSKILAAEQGGAILHDDDAADPWFRRMRFDGRTEGVATIDDNYREIGLHCIMLPSTAAQLLLKLSFLPKHNQDLPEIEYPDLSKFEVFK